jgi:hypothetical protein
MPPSITPTSTHYALVIDAGSSGSRLQIYSWRDPDLERAEIVAEVRDAARLAAKSRDGNGNGNGAGRKWWWPPGYKGKGKEREGELEWRALRRLVRVGKGVDGDAWVKRVEPGESASVSSCFSLRASARKDAKVVADLYQGYPVSALPTSPPTSLLCYHMLSSKYPRPNMPPRQSTSSQQRVCVSYHKTPRRPFSRRPASCYGRTTRSHSPDHPRPGHAGRTSVSSLARKKACGVGSP